MQQACRQDFTAGGDKNHKKGTFFKYSIGCMQQPGGQTWNGVTAFNLPPPAGDGPAYADLSEYVFIVKV